MGYRLATPEEVRRAGIRPLAPSQGRGDSKHSRYASPNIVRRLRSDAAWPAGPGTHLRSQLVHHAKVCMMVTRRALPLNARQHWAHDCDGIAWHVDDPANRSKAVQQLTRNNVWDNASRHGAAFSATVPFVRSAPAHALPAAVAVAANEGGLSLKGTTLFLDVRPALWPHLCIWSNLIFPLWEGIYLGELDGLPPVRDVVVWQATRRHKAPFVRDTLALVVEAARRRHAQPPEGGGVVDAHLARCASCKGVRIHYTDSFRVGSVACFEHMVRVRLPRINGDSSGLAWAGWQSAGTRARPSAVAFQSSLGCASGFSSRAARLSYREALLWMYDSHRYPKSDRDAQARARAEARAWAPLSAAEAAAWTLVEGGAATGARLGRSPESVGREVSLGAAPPPRRTITLLERSHSIKRCRLSHAAIMGVRRIAKRAGYTVQLHDFDLAPRMRTQALLVYSTNILITAHGAALTHLPLLPEGAVVLELFNCEHFAYGYANLARASQLYYEAVRRPERECQEPRDLTGDTRARMNENYAYTLDVIAPFVRRAIRYQWWFDHPSSAWGLGSAANDTNERTNENG